MSTPRRTISAAATRYAEHRGQAQQPGAVSVERDGGCGHGVFQPDLEQWPPRRVLVVSVFLWIRATFPRYRYDQIMRLGWKVFIPVTLIWIVVLGAWMQTPLWVWWGGTFE